MKKLVVVLASAAILAIGSAGAAFAQTPADPQQWGWGNMMGRGANGSYDPAKNPVVQRMADKLGISASDLAAQVKAGKSVAEVAGSDAKVDELVGVIQAPMVEMMRVMTAYGYADQEQIDSMLSYMTEYTKASLEQKGLLGTGMMGGGMMGGFSGGMMSGAGNSGQGFGGMMGGSGGMMGGGADNFGRMMGGTGSGFGGMMGGR